MSRTVPGSLGMRELAELSGRDRHRPRTQDEMRAAIVELRSRGYSDHGIAAATELSVEAVRRLLGEVS